MTVHGFGIVGLGLIAEFHAKAIQAMGSGELMACFSRSQEKADRFAERFGCSPYSSYSDFLSHPGLEIVTVCTPSGAHLEPALEAIHTSKHVIVEKPLEVTLPRCDAMIEAAEKAGVKLAGVFPSRFHEVSAAVKKAVEMKRFGRIALADAYVKWYRSQEYYDEGGWKGSWRYDGGGALMNQSIHAIDLLQWFMGPVLSVQAFTALRGHEGIEVEDTAAAALRFEGGALGIIEGTTAAFPGFLKKIEISGDKGSVIMEEESLKVWQFDEDLQEDDGVRDRYFKGTESGGGAADPGSINFQGHQKQFEDFCRVIDTGGQPLVDGLEARKAVEIILAIYKSAQTGRRVDLPFLAD